MSKPIRLFICVVAGLLWGCEEGSESSSDQFSLEDYNEAVVSNARALGELRILLTDPPSDPMISSVEVVIRRVEVHSESLGWLLVSDEQRTVDLLTLRDAPAELGIVSLPTGVYSQIRLFIDSGSLVVNGERQSLFVPSGIQSGVKLVGDFVVRPNQRIVLVLDFDASASIHKTGASWKLKPTIKLLGGGLDFDGDGVADIVDNCPAQPNVEQSDTDSDGIGDACDDCPDGVDSDSDGVCDDIDSCPQDFDRTQIDIDDDGIGDICDSQRCFTPVTQEEKQASSFVMQSDARVVEALGTDRFRTILIRPVCVDYGPDAVRMLRVRFFNYDKNQTVDGYVNLEQLELVRLTVSDLDPLPSTEEVQEAKVIAESDPRIESILSVVDTTLTTSGHFGKTNSGLCQGHRCIRLMYSSRSGNGTYTSEGVNIGWTGVSHGFLAVVDLTTNEVVSLEVYDADMVP